MIFPKYSGEMYRIRIILGVYKDIYLWYIITNRAQARNDAQRLVSRSFHRPKTQPSGNIN